MASTHNSYGAPMKQDNSTLQSDSYAKQLALAVRVRPPLRIHISLEISGSHGGKNEV
jgi:hypothetical protein